jgi:hypothetical protein
VIRGFAFAFSVFALSISSFSELRTMNGKLNRRNQSLILAAAMAKPGIRPGKDAACFIIHPCDWCICFFGRPITGIVSVNPFACICLPACG